MGRSRSTLVGEWLESLSWRRFFVWRLGRIVRFGAWFGVGPVITK